MPRTHPYLAGPHPVGFAHRGGTGVHPENTERAFRHAVDLGFSHIETDVHITLDGVAIAFHDDRLDRVTDAEGLIAETPWNEIRQARVGGTEPIVQLHELFEAFPDTCINIDPKSDAAVEPLADTILRMNATDRVMVGAFSDKRIAEVRRRVGEDLAFSAGPRRTLAWWLRSRGVPTRAGWADAAQVPVRVKGVTLVDRRFVDHLHDLGIHVHVWTIDDPEEMHRLLALGVDGIITDRPERLRAVLTERGVWPGATEAPTPR